LAFGHFGKIPLAVWAFVRAKFGEPLSAAFGDAVAGRQRGNQGVVAGFVTGPVWLL
jgi:hypothetical protein